MVLTLAFLLASIGVVVFAGLGLVDALRHKDEEFRAADKLSRNVWLGILGASIFAALVQFQILVLAGIVAVIVYHVDVKVAVREASGGGWR